MSTSSSARDVLLINGSGGTDVCTGHRVGLPSRSRCTRARSPGPCLARRRARVRRGRATRCVGELGELVITQPMPSMPVGAVGRPRRRALPSLLLRPLPGRVAPGRLDQVHRARQLRDHRALRRHAQPRRGAAGHRRVLLPWSRSFPEVADALVVHLEDGERRDRRAAAVRGRRARRGDRRRPCADRIATRAAHRALAAPRPRRDRRGAARFPRTLTGKKLEAPVKRILRGEPPEQGGQPRLAGRPRRARRVRRARRASAQPHARSNDGLRPTQSAWREIRRDEMALAHTPGVSVARRAVRAPDGGAHGRRPAAPALAGPTSWPPPTSRSRSVPPTAPPRASRRR